MEALYPLESETNVPGVHLCPKLRREHVWLTPWHRLDIPILILLLHSLITLSNRY